MRQLREPEAVIAIVDNDPSVRSGLQRLIRSAGWKPDDAQSKVGDCVTMSLWQVRAG